MRIYNESEAACRQTAGSLSVTASQTRRSHRRIKGFSLSFPIIEEYLSSEPSEPPSFICLLQEPLSFFTVWIEKPFLHGSSTALKTNNRLRRSTHFLHCATRSTLYLWSTLPSTDYNNKYVYNQSIWKVDQNCILKSNSIRELEFNAHSAAVPAFCLLHRFLMTFLIFIIIILMVESYSRTFWDIFLAIFC